LVLKAKCNLRRKVSERGNFFSCMAEFKSQTYRSGRNGPLSVEEPRMFFFGGGRNGLGGGFGIGSLKLL